MQLKFLMQDDAPQVRQQREGALAVAQVSGEIILVNPTTAQA